MRRPLQVQFAAWEAVYQAATDGLAMTIQAQHQSWALARFSSTKLEVRQPWLP
jgi:hypothetical protein